MRLFRRCLTLFFRMNNYPNTSEEQGRILALGTGTILIKLQYFSSIVGLA